jgi:hypothetical protein
MIRIETEPWVSTESVAATHRKLQQFMLGTGRDNRPVLMQSMAVFEFVGDRRFQTGGEPDYEALLAEWNEKSPEKFRYSTEYKLKQAYKNTARRILTPDYHMPGDP